MTLILLNFIVKVTCAVKLRTKSEKKMAGDGFSIDDAFQSDEDDAIRLYGATNESCPLQSKKRSYEDMPTTDQVRRILHFIFQIVASVNIDL